MYNVPIYMLDYEKRITELKAENERLSRLIEIGFQGSPPPVPMQSLLERLAAVEAENSELRVRLLSAAGDDLCRLSQEEIKQYTSGKVQIPPKDEFIASCERFHAQVAGDAGVLGGCLTLAQLIAENAKLQAENANLRADQSRLNTLLGYGGTAEVRQCSQCDTPYPDFSASSHMRCLECRLSEARP